MWDYLSKLSLTTGSYILIVLMGNVLAPFWYLFQFYPRIFDHYDLVKLLLIGASFGIPLTMFHLIMLSVLGIHKIVEPDNVGFEEEMKVLMLVSSFVTFGVLFSPSIYPYFLGHDSERAAIKSSILCEFGGIMGVIVTSQIIKRRKKRKSTKLSSSSTTPTQGPPNSQP